MLPDPVIVEHEGFLVVRDDLLPGGTKRRAMHVFFDDKHDEYVYPSPVFGYAQVALAYACRDRGRQAVIFCAKRNTRHALTQETEAAGAQILEIPHGYLNVVKARAREYCQRWPTARLLPFGLDDPLFIKTLAVVARALPVQPQEVWSVVGSGVLSRALQLAWPGARFFGVRVGALPNAGCAMVLAAKEGYEQKARQLPPFPSCPNYDAKMWALVKQHAARGALVWNVGR